MTFDNLLIERDGAVATVTLNRPKVLNALNSQLLTELAAAMAALKDDDFGVGQVPLDFAGSAHAGGIAAHDDKGCSHKEAFLQEFQCP